MDTRTAHEAFSSSSSSFSSSKCWMYDVFLSFRGHDTRKGFTGHLHMTMEKAGINTFIDNQLRRGEEITAELVQAIQGSRISVIVFSTRYADSSWCLEELVKIMECRRTFGQIVLPIFYDVDPSDVRKQTGIFAEAFQKHKERFQKDTDHKVERWRAALTEASNLSGWDLRNVLDGHEAEFIQKIIKEITGLLNTTYLDVSDYQVGIDSRVQAVAECLGVGLNDVRIIGIWGMGGIGKTTVAKAIYNKFYDRFDGKSFLEKVGEKQLVDLQKQLLYDILKPTKIKVSSVAEGINLIGKRLGSLKVLVIIDDIDSAEQLGALAIKRDTFGEGSRVIITTRDEHFLNTLRVDKIYRVQPMKEEEALELLSWHAFKNASPNQGYFELAREVVDYCGGLPLALQVLGSFLFTRSTREWESSLVKLKKIPPAEIQKKLKISYDGLSDDYEREIFLDISCFFIGMDKNYVTQILDGCGFSAEIGITVLIERCLVKVNERNKLIVHDLLRDMGRELERAKSPKYPGKRSRLWHLEDAKDVLTTKYETEAIEGLSLNLQSPSPEETSFSAEAFTKMKRLRLLKLNYVQLTGGYEYLFKNLSTNLRWLCWHGFPLGFIPKDFYQPNIVAIDMRYSSLRQVVSKDSKLLEKLKILNLSHSHYLTRSPDFSKLPNLEKLMLKDCRSLSQVHESIGDLKSLVLVNFRDCEVLKCLPRSFYKLKSIQNLVLNGCSRFKILAEDLGNMVSLTTLLANKTAIRKVPSSIVRLKKLEYLSLCDLKSPLQLPPSLGGLYSLRKLSLRDCNLEAIPKDLGSLSCLESLDLDKNNFHCLPNLSALSNLKSLSLKNCNLTDHAIASMDLGCISSLEDLHLTDNDFHTLPSLNGLSKLGCLLLNGCKNLSKIRELPACLDILQANDCTALERMPNISEMSSSLSIDNCPKIIEIPGLNSALNLGMDLHMQGQKNITDIVLKDSMLQGWTGYGQIFLTGNDIPKWFQHVKEGAEVDFEVPLEIGCNLQALAVCMVYSNSHSNHLCDRTSLDDRPASIYVINHTKRTGYAARILSCYIRASHEDCLWLGHLSNTEFDLEGGDFVHVIVDIENYNLRVKKTGVRLVCDKIVNFGGFSFIEYRPIAYSEVIKDFSIDVDDDNNEDEDDDDYDDDDDDNDNDDDDDDDDDEEEEEEEEEETPPKRLRFN